MSGPVEGVIKFRADHTRAVLDEAALTPMLGELRSWRDILWRLGLIGRDPKRYDGAAYGNVSARVPPFGLRPKHRTFVVSGSQTGDRPTLALTDVALVSAYDAESNWVESRGEVLPSSESMTHATLYELDADVRFVFHIHSASIWRAATALGLPCADASAAYGTPEMTREVRRLFRSTALASVHAFVMGGHEDGVVSFGRSAEAAGTALVRVLARAETS